MSARDAIRAREAAKRPKPPEPKPVEPKPRKARPVVVEPAPAWLSAEEPE